MMDWTTWLYIMLGAALLLQVFFYVIDRVVMEYERNRRTNKMREINKRYARSNKLLIAGLIESRDIINIGSIWNTED